MRAKETVYVAVEGEQGQRLTISGSLSLLGLLVAILKRQKEPTQYDDATCLPQNERVSGDIDARDS